MEITSGSAHMHSALSIHASVQPTPKVIVFFDLLQFCSMPASAGIIRNPN